MSLIHVSNLTFSYEGSYDAVFDEVSFMLDTDWRLGLIGRNGRGKTTLLRLLSGEYHYNGTITSSVRFEYFPPKAADPGRDTLSVVESAYSAELWRLKKELSLLGVAEDALYRPFDTLSGGERVKALLAGLFSGGERFLLIDEPTNHLDGEARRLVGDYLAAKKGFILASHDRGVLDRCADHILSINKADLTVQKGNFSSWFADKERQDHFELNENEKLKKEIKKLSAAAKRSAAWSDKTEKTKYHTLDSGLKPDKGYIGHKSAKLMKRAKNADARRQEAASKKEGLLKNLEAAESLSFKPLTYHGERLAEFSGVSIRYGERTVCGPLSFSVKNGDRIALRGKNGSGKSSVLKLLGGLRNGCGIAHEGGLYTGGGLIVSYVPQDTSFLSGGLREFAKDRRIDESLFKTILRKFGFSREQFDKDTRDFSEGQKKQVLLAGSLCESAHLYVWDEPLNFIDVFSRMQIEQLMIDFCPTMIFAEHDLAFTAAVATKQVEV
jgi:lincosamide and streptogramin A transport system ATP-binding/permease protein